MYSGIRENKYYEKVFEKIIVSYVLCTGTDRV